MVIDTTKDLSALFRQQVKKSPNAPALEDDDNSYTYAELDQKVSELADRLRNNYGVGRDVLVGVLMSRSADYVITCLAANRAGGAFLVLELAYPSGLLAGVLDDARPAVVVTHEAHAGLIASDVPLIVLDRPESANGAVSNGGKEPSPLPADDDLERLAFVSYTSGTTGRPKGIGNPHSAPVNSYNLRFEISDLQPGDRVACNVFFIWEILRPLLRGATVYTVPDQASYDPGALVDLLASRNITETLMTPTLLAAALSRHPQLGNSLPALRTLWLNGEVVTTDLARRAMKALPNARLLNCYSISEAHEVACGDIKKQIDYEVPYCPVGPPIVPKQTYVLNEDGKEVPPGETGELYVGGPLLARGYLNLPETTAKSFVPDPFDPTPGARMYRTGDIARILPSGLLEITGRVGAMIKLRGYSIVPAKVEAAIIEHLAVRQCVVVAHGDGLERQLVAYIVRDKESPGDRPFPAIDESGLSPEARRTLNKSLAQYMVPALWVELDVLPTHGVSAKVDLKSLLPPTSLQNRRGSMHRITGRDPKINIEAVAEVWAQILKVKPETVLKIRDFFDLGGHSLTLAELAAKLTAVFGFQVPLTLLAGQSTLEGHLRIVRGARDGHVAAIQSDLPAVLQADSILPEDFKPTGAPFRPLSEAKTVLLTGATGFLGGFLLADLVEHTTANILCLVRFADPTDDDYAAGMARVRKNLLDLGIWRDTLSDRIEIVPGNIARERLGLSQQDFDQLGERVDVIVHAGATVNLVYPYAALRNANVNGTREIIRLACQGGATLQYISTNGVLPPADEGWAEDANLEVDDVPARLMDGYGHTKWVAEQLIYEAGRRGLPFRISRPGTISGHSVSGSTNTYDLINALLVESVHLGYAPDIKGWRAEMAPVDYVSKAIIDIGNDASTEQRVFHLGDADPVYTDKLFKDLAELGFPTETLPFDEWTQLWTEKRSTLKGGDGAFTVDILRRGMPSVDYLKKVVILKDEKTRATLGDLHRPKVDLDLLETYARHWFSRGWLPRAPRRKERLVAATGKLQKGPLSGRVAVITGASSGIGAAVAAALAREGAHIALAARRVDALKQVEAKLATHGGKVLIHQTDVTQRTQVESLVQAATEQLGPVDILVSCAGVMYFTMMANVKVDQWEQTVDVNCKGLLHCLSSVVPSMLTRGTGHIVAISSDAGRKVFAGLGVYSASKFFVEATLQSLRLETAGSGLRVTSVQPGNVATDLLGMSNDEEALKKYGEPSGAKVLDPSDVAESIVYALRQPPHVAVNEVLIEPRDEPI